MLPTRLLSIFSWIVLLLLVPTYGLDCEPDEIKVFVKLSDPTQFDANEMFLFQSITAYAVRDYCSENSGCSSGAATIGYEDVMIANQTERVSFCMYVNTVSNEITRSAINSTLDRFYGGLKLSSDVLQIEGVDPILSEDEDPDFPIWLIPFIVIAALVILAALAMLYFSLKPSNNEMRSDEKDQLTSSEEGDEEIGYEGPLHHQEHDIMKDDEQRTEL